MSRTWYSKAYIPRSSGDKLDSDEFQPTLSSIFTSKGGVYIELREVMDFFLFFFFKAGLMLFLLGIC